jgi:hypothetical protein
MKTGDKITVAGIYQRRTFWQWLKNRPRKLQSFEVIATTTSEGYFDNSPIPFKRVDMLMAMIVAIQSFHSIKKAKDIKSTKKISSDALAEIGKILGYEP